MEIKKQFGERLRQVRSEQGITQEELSKRAGFHRTYEGNIERGLENPTIEAVAKLADTLDVPMHQLFRFDRSRTET